MCSNKIYLTMQEAGKIGQKTTICQTLYQNTTCEKK